MPSSIQTIRLYSMQISEHSNISPKQCYKQPSTLCLLKTEACGWYENGIRCRWQIPAEGDLLNDNFVQSCCSVRFWSVRFRYWTILLYAIIYLWKLFIMTALSIFSIVQMTNYSLRICEWSVSTEVGYYTLSRTLYIVCLGECCVKVAHQPPFKRTQKKVYL